MKTLETQVAAAIIEALGPALEKVAKAVAKTVAKQAEDQAREAVRAELVSKLGGAPAPAPAPAPTRAKAKDKASTERKAVDKTCRVPGCDNVGRGPRFRWLCDEHRELPAPASEEAQPEPTVEVTPSTTSNGVSESTQVAL